MDDPLTQRLLQLRERCAGRRGQRAFARSLGIKQQSMSNYERGVAPPANVLARIVLATGCSADWLLTGRGTMFSDPAFAPVMESDFADEESPVWRDLHGEPVTADSLATQLGIAPAEAQAILLAVPAQVGGVAKSRGRARPVDARPMEAATHVMVRKPNGDWLTLRRDLPDDDQLAGAVAIEVTDSEIQVRLPLALMRRRSVRIIPS